MAYSTQNLRFLVRGGLLAALKAATGALLRPLARELTIATDALSLRVGTGTGEYVDLSVLNPVTPSFQFRTKTSSTTDADPGDGFFKWNNATQASATFLYFDDKTSGTGTDLSTLYTSLAGSGSGLIHIVLEEDRTKWQVWKWTALTAGTGYRKFAVTLQASSGSLGDNLPVRVTFLAPMPTGVVAGSYTNANLTVSSDGRITVAGNGSAGTSGWSLVKKTSDETRVNTTTPSADGHLTVTLNAGKVVSLRVFVFYTTTNATPDIKVTETYSGTLTSVNGFRRANNPPIGGETISAISALLTNGAFTSSNIGSGYIVQELILVTNTAGTYTFNWSQNTLDAVNAVTIKAGSYIQYAEF